MEPLTIPSSRILAPHISELGAPYWEGTSKGELRAQRCDECGTFRFPPLPSCRNCGSQQATWVELKSAPTLYSWVIVEHSTQPEVKVPYCVALAEFEEGVRVPGVLLYDRATVTPHAGDALGVEFHALESGHHVPLFRLRDE